MRVGLEEKRSLVSRPKGPDHSPARAARLHYGHLLQGDFELGSEPVVRAVAVEVIYKQLGRDPAAVPLNISRHHLLKVFRSEVLRPV